MRNKLPRKIHEKESGIVNLDDVEGEGTHWVSYVKRGSRILYFDSVGQSKPPLELIRYFRSDGSSTSIYYNYSQLQKLNAYTCGHHTLKFLYAAAT